VALSEAAHARLIAEVERLEQELFSKASAYTPESNGKKILSTAKNYRSTGSFIGSLRTALVEVYRKIARLLISDTEGIFDDVEDFYDTAKDLSARELVFLRLGYDPNKQAIIEGGYLHQLFSNERTAARVSAMMNTAIAQGMSLKDFQANFAAIFSNAGVLKQHFETNTYDLYQMIDRMANKVYADRLGLTHAIYSGTIMKTTRQFCKERVNRVYTDTEIKAWASLEWNGKFAVGYDPFIHCGGHRCRHHLSYISKGVAEQLLKKQNVSN
jgi:hypothetical protein